MSGGGPTVIAGLREIVDQFDYLLVDQFGTVHDGRHIFAAARSCITRLRAAGKRILILSNSGKRAADNVCRLEKLKLPPSAYDGLLSSGEVAWQGLRDRTEPPFDQLGRRCMLVTRGDDHAIVDGLGLQCVLDPSLADFIFLAGLDDEWCEPDLWRRVLGHTASRRVPLLCANPDLTMFGAGGLLPGPGALAQLYESLGGLVHYVGKPHGPIFAAALRALGGPPPARVLVIGDSLDHDICGGNESGMLTALIASGVHRPVIPTTGDPKDLAVTIQRLAASHAALPRWVLSDLAW
jgi:HAD superfamily hydrolase (TIGR01459 family)